MKQTLPTLQKTSIRPVGHHLVVAPITLPEKSKGGIIIKHGGTDWDRLQKASRMLGVVLAVGPQCWRAHAAALADSVGTNDPSLHRSGDILGAWAKVGDTVFYNRHAGKFMFDPVYRIVAAPADKEETVSEFGAFKSTEELQSELIELYVINDDDVIAVLPPMEEWTVDALDVMTY